MRRTARSSIFIAAALALALVLTLLATGRVQAQSSSMPKTVEDPPNFFEVQQYDQPFAGWAEPTLWNTFVGPSGQRFQHFGQDLPRRDLWAHSLELEYGVTDRLTLGGYVDFVDAHGIGTHYTQTRLLARYRFSDRQELFVNPAIYFEYYLPDKAYGDQQLETRLILDKDIGDFRFVANPTISFNTTGDRAGHAPNIGLSGGVYWRRHAFAQPGLEYYADYGAVNRIDKTKQYLLPSVDLAVTRNITWHIGVGFGLTSTSDHVVAESQLRFEFDLLRPSHLFGHTPR